MQGPLTLAERLGWWLGRAGGNSFCGDAPGSGSRRRLGQGREQEKSNDAGGPPLPGLPGLGDCHLRSMLSVCSPVTVLSHLLGVGRGRKSAPWSWLPEERARKEAVGRPQGEGNLLVSLGSSRMFIHPFMVLDSSVV